MSIYAFAPAHRRIFLRLASTPRLRHARCHAPRLRCFLSRYAPQIFSACDSVSARRCRAAVAHEHVHAPFRRLSDAATPAGCFALRRASDMLMESCQRRDGALRVVFARNGTVSRRFLMRYAPTLRRARAPRRCRARRYFA